MRARSWLLGALVATLGLPVASAAAPVLGPSPGADGIGDPYFPLDGNGGYDVTRYEIHQRYRFGTGRLAGRTEISMTPTQDLSSFDLDFLLTVSSVTVQGAPATYARLGGHELVVTPAQPLVAGSPVTVVVRYDDRPARYGYAGERNWLADRREVVAMNEPHMAPWWFPSNDHPLDKAVVDLFVTVPRGQQAIGNGLLRGRTRAARTTTWHWRSAQPMAPYLAFFAAGRFELAGGTAYGVPWTVAVSRQLPTAAHSQAMTLLRRTPGIVHWLSQELGDYPFDSTGGLITSLPVGFALENQTRPTYPVSGAGDTWLLVHELAHQWFGDSVSVRHWRDIWLNEGFASYLEWRYSETHGGASTAETLRNLYDGYSGGSSIWSLAIADPGPSDLFDYAVYQRGAMTLAALRQRIGDADFATLLRTWAADHRLGNASDAEFRALAATVSGQDLDAFFTAWLDTPVKPADTSDNGLG